MRILSIETSCDETAVSIVQVDGDFPDASYHILGDALHSQIDIHAEYGGVFPALAKREHAKKLVPMLKKALTEAEMLEDGSHEVTAVKEEEIRTLLYREPELADALLEMCEQYDSPEFDIIAVTSGPGLEPALWVGVNFAKALASLWNVPVVPVNHMEGHILASIFDIDRDDQLTDISFPALALLISGGHTEFVLMKDWGQYEKVGQTQDDAVGEAFDKVARMMGIPYPGGPAVSKLADEARKQKLPVFADLPRPMINSGDLNMSFSGLKTAVRYAIGEKELSEDDKKALSRDFEDAVTEVLIKKIQKALDQYGAQTFIVGGGVSANQHLRHSFNAVLLESNPDVEVYFPHRAMSTDNSIMIALSGHARAAGALAPAAAKFVKADGNRSLSNE